MDNIFIIQTLKEVIDDKSNFEEPGAVFGDFIKEGELAIVGAATNNGKTVLCCDIAFANASNISYWDEPISDRIRNTLYIDFEMSDSQVARRYVGIPADVSASVKRAHLNSFVRGCSTEDKLGNIEELVSIHHPELLIIDNLMVLMDNTISSSVVKKVMERLKYLKEVFGLTIILVAHFHKHNRRNPIEISNIQGSSIISNYADSIVAIGDSNVGPETKYLKQLKTRSTIKMPGVAVMNLEESPYLHFEFVEFDDELNHLETKQTDRGVITELIGRNILELSSEGKSVRAIADMLGISKSVVGRFLKNQNP